MPSNDSPAQVKVLPLPSQLQRFSSLVSSLHSSISNLEDRTAPVRTSPPMPPSAAGRINQGEDPMPSNVTACLARLNERLEEGLRRLEVLKEQLDL